MQVEESEITDYYDQHTTDRFTRPEEVHARHILVDVAPEADDAAKAAAHKKAEGLLAKVRGKADFAEVATKNSDDPGSASKGGDLGFFPRGRMSPAFEDAAFALAPGAISDIVETPFGFHIIKVHAHRPPRTVPFAEASGQIKEFLARNQRETKLEQFVTQAKAKSKVEMLV